MAKVSKGEVWIVDLPGAGGHVQKGQRPAVIVAESNFVQVATVVPLTSTESAAKFPHTFKVNPTKENGLQTESTALVFQLTTIDSSLLKDKMGKLSEQDVKNLDTLLRDFLKL
ncbi:MAG: type II toxin-antitoxin system PemK/MazF family toxin [Candidatus Micrarchaeota archaeon]